MKENSKIRYYWHGADRVGVGKLEGEKYCVFRPGWGWHITAISPTTITGKQFPEITREIAEAAVQGSMPGIDVSEYFRPVVTREIRDQIFKDLKAAGGEGVTLTVEGAKHWQDKVASSFTKVDENTPEWRQLKEKLLTCEPEAYENDEDPKYYRHGIEVSDEVKNTPDYYVLGEKEAVLGRVLNWRYSYLDPKIGQWVEHPEVQDLIIMGSVFELPAQLPFAFPGWAREISAEEAETFLAQSVESQAKSGRRAAAQDEAS